MLTEAQLRKLVERKKWGAWIEYHHHSLADAEVYEIWTYTNEKGKNKKTPQTRFVFEDEDGSKQYFDYFVNLVRYLHKRFLLAARHGAELEFAIKRETEALNNKKFTLRVAGIAFLAAAVALIAVVVIHSDEIFANTVTTWLAVAAVTGLVSSGAIAFFGVWRPITVPKSVLLELRTPPSVDLVASQTETPAPGSEPLPVSAAGLAGGTTRARDEAS
jgi:hypothetical protein